MNEIKQKQRQKSHIIFKLTCILLFDLVHKQYNGIIKGWFHCLASESKGRFLANNILLVRCLVKEQIQFSLIKKTKDWTSRTLANPPTPTSNNISFLPYPLPTPHQSGRHMCITPNCTYFSCIKDV